MNNLSEKRNIAVIAGSGEWPKILHQQCYNGGYDVFVVAFHNNTWETTVENVAHDWFYLGEIGKIIRILSEKNITDVVMAGKFIRPSLKDVKPDMIGAMLLARIGLFWPGDDKIMRIIADFLDEKGFKLRAPNDVIPNVLLSSGTETVAKPNAQHMNDVIIGINMLKVMAPLDFGQGVAMQNGIVLGVEADEGTDQCILRCGGLKRPVTEHNAPPVYVKLAKDFQDDRMDLPTIGVNTIKNLRDAGFSGIACSANRTIVIDERAVIDCANENNIFILGF